MSLWTIFWITVIVVTVWTLRHFIAIGILAIIAAIAGALGLATFSAFEQYERFDNWRHDRKYKRK
jgi:hypothetical protein